MIIYLAGYGFRFALLLYAIYMIVRAHRSFNGLARGLVALSLLLAVRTIDDLGHVFGLNVLDDTATLLLSSLVVLVFFLDVQRIYKEHPLREMSRKWRHKREDELEQMREQSERGASWDAPAKRIL